MISAASAYLIFVCLHFLRKNPLHKKIAAALKWEKYRVHAQQQQFRLVSYFELISELDVLQEWPRNGFELRTAGVRNGHYAKSAPFTALPSVKKLLKYIDQKKGCNCFLNGPLPASFFSIFVFLIQLTSKKICWWLDTNPRHLMSEATTLPTKPQPLPRLLLICMRQLKFNFMPLRYFRRHCAT